jgi:hypothetical protein
MISLYETILPDRILFSRLWISQTLISFQSKAVSLVSIPQPGGPALCIYVSQDRGTPSTTCRATVEIFQPALIIEICALLCTTCTSIYVFHMILTNSGYVFRHEYATGVCNGETVHSS